MRRLVGLQYLRGLAACAVVLHHAMTRAGFGFHAGEAGVDLFFVLSGFLMWAITDERSRPGRFWLDRIKRIVPVYWIATTVVLAGALIHLFPAMHPEAAHVIASYLFLPWVSPSNGGIYPLLVPGWTLNYEMFFYLLFGLALLLPRPAQLGATTAMFGGVVAARLAFDPAATALHFYTDPQILEFLGGIALAVVWQRGLLDDPAKALPLVAGAIALAAGLAVAAPDAHRLFGFGLPALLIVAAMLAWEARPGGVPEWRLPRWIGDASYSIYLWHTLAVSTVGTIGEKLHASPAEIVAACATAGLATGLATHALIETPILKAFHRKRYRHGAPVPSGV